MIEKIVLKIDKQTIELTLEQAEKLKDELSRLFGKSEWVTYPIYPRPYYPYEYPWVITSDSTAVPPTTTEYYITV